MKKMIFCLSLFLISTLGCDFECTTFPNYHFYLSFFDKTNGKPISVKNLPLKATSNTMGGFSFSSFVNAQTRDTIRVSMGSTTSENLVQEVTVIVRDTIKVPLTFNMREVRAWKTCPATIDGISLITTNSPIAKIEVFKIPDNRTDDVFIARIEL